MLDRTKERIAKFEEDHEAVRKVRLHVKKHRAKYSLAVGTGIGVGATIIVMKRFGSANMLPLISADSTVAQTAAIDLAASYKPHIDVDQSQHVVQHIHQQFGGYTCKILQDAIHPELMWPKIQTFCEQIGKEHNVTADQVRRMVNRYWEGKIDDVFGYHPQKYGVTTTG